MSVRNRVRIDDVWSEKNYLANEIENWFDRYKNQGQYKTQLNTLKIVIEKALNGLSENIAGLREDGNTGEIYEACRVLERRLVWLRAVWRYYGRKFDQRQDPNPQVQNTLKAADEIVWSCYAGAYRAATGDKPAGAVPLPYIEPLYTPKAIPRTFTHVLKDRVLSETFLNDVLEKLPIPTIGLPPNCIQAPWWLIFIGHEAGHHIQFDLLPNQRLVTDFDNWLGGAAASGAAGKQPSERERLAGRWSSYGKEVFADAFSIYNMGVWAAWAMMELEKSAKWGMLVEKGSKRSKYPPPIVRLSLMGQLARALTGDEEQERIALQNESANDYANTGNSVDHRLVRTDLDTLPAIVQAVQDFSFEGVGRLSTASGFANLCAWNSADYAKYGRADIWRDALLGRGQPIEEATWDAPRIIISSGVAAWAQVRAIEDNGARDEARAALQESLPRTIIHNHEGGDRSVGEKIPKSEVEAVGDEFAELLLNINPDSLEL